MESFITVLVIFYLEEMDQPDGSQRAAGGAEAAANRVFAVAEGTPPSVATDVVVLCN